MDGMDKNKTFLIVGLGLLGGKYAQVLSQKGYRVTGITHSQSTLDYALEHAYICEGRNENFDDLVQNADYIIFGLYPTVLLEWVKQYGHLVRAACWSRCSRCCRRAWSSLPATPWPAVRPAAWPTVPR